MEEAKAAWLTQFNGLATTVRDAGAIIEIDGQTFMDAEWAVDHPALVDAYQRSLQHGYLMGWL